MWKNLIKRVFDALRGGTNNKTGQANNEIWGFTYEELDILNRIAWAEAGCEDEKGIILVINVIINRLRDPRFPSTVREVVYQENQFEPTRNGAMERAVPDEKTIGAVRRALRGEDYSRGATFFRTVKGADGSWHERNLKKLFDHGGHRFYA